MKWKVTRNGEDIYPGGEGIRKIEALQNAGIFNRWAEENGDGRPYGIRPVKEPAPAKAEHVYTDDSVMTPYGRFGPGFDSHDPPWRGGVDRF